MQRFVYESPIGRLYLVASQTGLRGIHFRKDSGDYVSEPTGIIKETVRQLAEYFAGQRREFTVPLELEGTEFQKKVWAQLLKIPFGQTDSYGGLARKIRNDKAVRAVGTANGKNPIAVIVPCHRVIQSNGTLGGYAGGLDLKSKLLDIERN